MKKLFYVFVLLANVASATAQMLGFINADGVVGYEQPTTSSQVNYRYEAGDLFLFTPESSNFVCNINRTTQNKFYVESKFVSFVGSDVFDYTALTKVYKSLFVRDGECPTIRFFGYGSYIIMEYVSKKGPEYYLGNLNGRNLEFIYNCTGVINLKREVNVDEMLKSCKKMSYKWTFGYDAKMEVFYDGVFVYLASMLGDKMTRADFFQGFDNAACYDENMLKPIEAFKQEKSSLTEEMEKESADKHSSAEEETFLVIDKQPSFPGGEMALREFLAKNLVYPKEEMMNGTQGIVVVRFVVERNGMITNVQVEKSVTPALDAEAMRVVELMPRWSPGYFKGEPLRIRYTLPFTFRLQ